MINKLAGLGLAAAVAMTVTTSYAADTVKLSFGLQQPVGSLEYRAAKEVADKLEALSAGTVTLEIFPSAQLGDDRAMLSQVSASELDMTYSEFGRFGLWEPEAAVVSQPYVVKDFDHLLRIMGSDWGQGVQKKLVRDHNWRILDTWYLGTRQTTSNKPIASINDFQGRKIRVPNAQANLDFVKNSGGSPVPMAFSEVYLALQTNAVDGQENPLPIINQNKFYEVQKYLALTNHILNDSNVVMSNSKYDALTNQQKAWLDAAIAAGGQLHTSEAKAAETGLIAFFEEQGMTITRPDTAAFRTAMNAVYKQFEGKVEQSGLVKELQAL